ncbi:hypothetical protein NPIL_394731 [Nephila pilipes]|uniref:Uncharacterized protein n=1 Tax=Nephila pilipes TaxID=299642 RepID=A0A8X6UCL8_NEPPI|nr:hypothetical protein NPIL_394731 [Nephila pilipes]
MVAFLSTDCYINSKMISLKLNSQTNRKSDSKGVSDDIKYQKLSDNLDNQKLSEHQNLTEEFRRRDNQQLHVTSWQVDHDDYSNICKK